MHNNITMNNNIFIKSNNRKINKIQKISKIVIQHGEIIYLVSFIWLITALLKNIKYKCSL